MSKYSRIDVANLYNASSHLLGNVAAIPIDAIPADAAYYDPQQHGSNHHQYQYAAFQVINHNCHFEKNSPYFSLS
jgi:hypothetical protein